MEDLYCKLTKAAYDYNCLHHYTTINALEAILRNRSIRLSRIDVVNDPVENKRINTIWKNRIFVACFTHDINENDMFWNGYAKRDKGVKITFNKVFNNIDLYGDEKCERVRISKIERANTEYMKFNDVSDWGYYDITLADVEYTDDLSKYMVLNEELYNEFNNCININQSKFYESVYDGLIKENMYRLESETRLRVAVKPIGFEYMRENNQLIKVDPSFEYIYMKLDDDLINNIIITLNPWSSELFTIKMHELLRSLDLDNKIKIQKSAFEEI